MVKYTLRRLLLLIPVVLGVALLIFIMPPSAEELHSRLAGRGSESDRVIRQRLRRAAKEGRPSPELPALDDTVERAANEHIRSLLHGLHR